MAEESDSDVPLLVIDEENLPVDLSTDGEFLRREKGTKKFDKLKLSEEEIEERRRAANFMERRRMKKMSTALADLRKCIPQQYHLYHRRMSKIRTLRLAIAYIKALKDILIQDDQRRQLMTMSHASFPYGGMRLPNEPFSPLSSSSIIAAYAAQGAQAPHKRQLMFSPEFRFQGFSEPRFNTPGSSRHPAYQTPDSHLYYLQSCSHTPASRKSAPEHTVSSPEEEAQQGKQAVITGYKVFPNQQDGASYPLGTSRQSSSCRYVADGLDGVCPLPEDDVPTDTT